jgi:hypothetical protein
VIRYRVGSASKPMLDYSGKEQALLCQRLLFARLLRAVGFALSIHPLSKLQKSREKS